MASWAEDQERSERYDEALRGEPGFMPDPKPAGRVKADLKDWERMHALLVGDHGRCQVCGKSWRESSVGLSLHHIVPKSAGGGDVPENLAVLCGHGTVGCHGDVEARRNDARTKLRLAMTPEQRQYVIDKKGGEYLRRHYPLRGEAPQTRKGMGSSDA